MGDNESREITEIGKYRAGGYGAIQTEETAAVDRELATMSPEDAKRVYDLISKFQSLGANTAGTNTDALRDTYKGVLEAADKNLDRGTCPKDLPAPDPTRPGKYR